jgi:hypothetical protein
MIAAPLIESADCRIGCRSALSANFLPGPQRLPEDASVTAYSTGLPR